MRKISIYNSRLSKKKSCIWIMIAVTFCLVLGFIDYGSAEKLTAAAVKNGIEDLHATANKVIFDSAEQYAEMIGNVRVTQGQTVITSNNLKIYYQKQSKTISNELPGNDAVEKIVAKGNVRIELDSGIAISDEAVYHTKTRELILTGNAKLLRGENTISGSKIIINRKNGRVTVESSGEKPVEAFIFSNEKL